jgi:predicted enzyme involved in methoxymalonyl-ACP biosynthesis
VALAAKLQIQLQNCMHPRYAFCSSQIYPQLMHAIKEYFKKLYIGLHVVKMPCLKFQRITQPLIGKLNNLNVLLHKIKDIIMTLHIN